MRLSTSLFQKIQKPLRGSGWCSGAILWERACSRKRWISRHPCHWNTALASKPAPTKMKPLGGLAPSIVLLDGQGFQFAAVAIHINHVAHHQRTGTQIGRASCRERVCQYV